MPALTIVAWVPAAVLIVSGALKLGRGERFAQSLGSMGLGWFAVQRWFVVAFPVLELVLGALAIAGAVVTPLAVVPMLLLHAVFLVVVTRIVVGGKTASCECFGGLDDGELNRTTVARNAALVVLSVLGILGGPADPRVAGIALLVAVALALALVAMRNRRAAAARATADAERARVVDSLTLAMADGTPIALAEFRDPATFLVFFTAGCSSCRTLVERFRWWPHGLVEGIDLQPVLLGRRGDYEHVEEFAPLIDHALYDTDREVAKLAGMHGTPGMIVVDAEHPLGDGWIVGVGAMEQRVLRPGFLDGLHSS